MESETPVVYWQVQHLVSLQSECGVPDLLVQTAENRVMDRQASHMSDVSEAKVEWQ